jgi:uncharacterized protein YkwD
MKQMKSPLAITLMLLFINTIQPAQAAEASMQTEILHHINQYRITHGLSRLTMNATISKEATQHSREMATHQLPFGHNKFDQRVKRLSKTIPYTNGCAENVAYNYKDAKDVVKNWLLSPGHLQNIRGHYNLTGIGVARDERGRIYYTQLFVRTRQA